MYTPDANKLPSYYSEEREYGDEIFRLKYRTVNQLSSIEEDTDYRYPDYKTYIFSNMGKGLYSIHKRNIAIPIRVKSFDIQLEINHRLSDIDKACSILKGVFILETFTIQTREDISHGHIIDYYLERHNIELPHKVLERIKNNVRERFNKYTSAAPIIFRLLTFIPETMLNEYRTVYHPDSDTIITMDIANSDVYHPKTKAASLYTDKSENIQITSDNIVSISIVDNYNPSRPYYIKVANKIERFISKQDKSKPSTANITISKHGKVTTSTDIPISELPNSGIYASLSDAESDNNTKLMLEKEIQELKIKHELEIHRSKVNMSILDNAHKLKMMQLDVRSKTIDNHRSYTKHKAELRKLHADNVWKILNLAITTAAKFI